MHDQYDGAVRTRTVARLVGPYLVVMGAALWVRRDGLTEFFAAFMQDEALVFVAGAFTLIAGLAIVVAHHHWSGFSAAAISLIGLGGSVKGAALMIAPNLGSDLVGAFTSAPLALQGLIGAQLCLGVWLSCAGWAARRS